jgi:hypothetical protein
MTKSELSLLGMTLLPLGEVMITLFAFGVIGVLPRSKVYVFEFIQEHHIRQEYMMTETFPFGNPVETVKQKRQN